MRLYHQVFSGRDLRTLFVVAGNTTTTYPKKMTTIDASKNTKCYEAVDFGFSRASAKSKGGDKSIGIDCIQSFEEDIEEGEDNKKKKQKKHDDDDDGRKTTRRRRKKIASCKKKTDSCRENRRFQGFRC